MPFDYNEYREKCSGMTKEQLQKEWENYTRQISAVTTSTAASMIFMPVMGGSSVVGVGLSVPRIHNARKKREIIEAGLKVRGTTYHTRKGDALASTAVSEIIGGLTLGPVPYYYHGKSTCLDDKCQQDSNQLTQEQRVVNYRLPVRETFSDHWFPYNPPEPGE
jgi:hypothetical protein